MKAAKGRLGRALAARTVADEKKKVRSQLARELHKKDPKLSISEIGRRVGLPRQSVYTALQASPRLGRPPAPAKVRKRKASKR